MLKPLFYEDQSMFNWSNFVTLCRRLLGRPLPVKRPDIPRPNWRRLANGTYLVRTQAGLRQAIKNFVGPDGNRRCQQGWPTVYPSIIRIRNVYAGVAVQAMPIKKYRAETQALLDSMRDD